MIFPDQLKKSACLLLPGRQYDLAALESAGWSLVDFDAFLENLPLWGDEAKPIEMLFSAPIPGIRQFLANVKQSRVGLYGDLSTLVDDIADRYSKLGYNILIECRPQRFIPARPSASTRITFEYSSKEKE